MTESRKRLYEHIGRILESENGEFCFIGFIAHTNTRLELGAKAHIKDGADFARKLGQAYKVLDEHGKDKLKDVLIRSAAALMTASMCIGVGDENKEK